MSKRLYGVLGESIGYSLSPRIFEWLFRKIGIDADYLIFDLPPEKAREFLQRRTEWQGLNVTTPYKDLAHESCARLSSEAIVTHSVNTIFRGPLGLIGANTDVQGFRVALDMLLTGGAQPARILVIGSGGAARSVLLGLSLRFPSAQVVTATRDPKAASPKVESLVSAFQSFTSMSPSEVTAKLDTFDLVIQATPLGCPLGEPLPFKPGAYVMDLIYAPRKTRFLQYAESSGAVIQNGLPMLIAQAIESFRIWTDIAFPLDQAMSELLPELAPA